MFLKSTKQKNGRINLSFVHGYRDPITKKTKHKVIDNLGYVDEYLDLYEDPIKHFKEVARMRTQEMKALGKWVGELGKNANKTVKIKSLKRK